jgi:hypothetical protein
LNFVVLVLESMEQRSIEADLLQSEVSYVEELMSCVTLYLVPLRIAFGMRVAGSLMDVYSDIAKSHARLQSQSLSTLMSYVTHIVALSPMYERFISQYNRNFFHASIIGKDRFFHSVLSSFRPQSGEAIVDSLNVLLGAPVKRLAQYTYYMTSLSNTLSEDTSLYSRALHAKRSFDGLQQMFLDETIHRRPADEKNKESVVEWLVSMNALCADCLSPEVTSVSVNLGVFLCGMCADIHHSLLPPHISLIESVTPAYLKRMTSWTRHPRGDEVLQFLMNSSNLLSSGIWEYNLKEELRPVFDVSQSSFQSTMSAFIRSKYLDRKFCNPDYGYFVKIFKMEIIVKKWNDRFLKIEVGPSYFRSRDIQKTEMYKIRSFVS